MSNLLFLIISATLFFVSPALAHEGHADETALTGSASAPAGTPITLSPEAIANLDVQTAKAELKALPEVLSMPAIVTLAPESQAFITTRFDGLIKDIAVKLGDTVSKGQNLVTVQPVSFGGQPVTLTSPIEGKIIQQNVVIGQPVTFETIMMEVGNLDQILVRGALYETPDLNRIQPGQKAMVDIGIYAGRHFEGVIQRIDAGPSADTRALHVYAAIDNPEEALKPNLRGNLTIHLDGETPTVVVPARAVLENNGASFLFVRTDDKFERREVQTGRRAGPDIEIVSGIFPDEEVVVQGNYQLQYLKAEAPAPKAEHTEDGGH